MQNIVIFFAYLFFAFTAALFAFSYTSLVVASLFSICNNSFSSIFISNKSSFFVFVRKEKIPVFLIGAFARAFLSSIIVVVLFFASFWRSFISSFKSSALSKIFSYLFSALSTFS
ncbi:MAG: hypothetical protein U9O87_05615 [Verrucomicrobiota bacterium]|nr:hypothetical protein [Verrucomicrobiota bacterium]